jgi:hypothetical protein
VADSRSYALLDVDRQLKIPLFPVSSLDESQFPAIGGQAEDISGTAGNSHQRSISSAQQGHGASLSVDRGHSRSTSLGNLIGGSSRRPSQGATSRERAGRNTPDRLFREGSPGPAVSPARRDLREPSPGRFSTSPEKPLPQPPSEPPAAEQSPHVAVPAPVLLRPHVISPSPQEFLLLTGTLPSDPGVGMFVNLEGDVTRSTLEFERYPDDLVADGRGIGTDLTANNAEHEEEGYVIASMTRGLVNGFDHGLEIQRWDLDPGEGSTQKHWLSVSHNFGVDGEEIPEMRGPGIRSVTDSADISFDEVVEKLRLRMFRPFAEKSTNASTLSLHSADSRTAASLARVSAERELFEPQKLEIDEVMLEGWEESRNEEEWQFAKRLGQARTRIAVWSGNHIWWAVRNPLALRLDGSLMESEEDSSGSPTHQKAQRRRIVEVINSLRGREAKTEIEFMSLGYIRQHAGLILLINLLGSDSPPMDSEDRIAEEALLEGSLDPRVILALVPKLRNEVIEGKNGIWIHGGVKTTAEEYIVSLEGKPQDEIFKPLRSEVLQFFRRFLSSWRRKKGFGSIANEAEVFRSTDASLLVVLLELDKSSPTGPARAGSIRAEINDLVDHGVDCFERAIIILESYNRLYILSRLFQSRKMAGEVLATWKRIIEGETDNGGELIDGEQVVRSYLSNIRNPSLVREYGVWLAARNPKLGIQIFADDRSRVKFEVTEVVEILRHNAPAAVKDYLEYLVFGKNHTEYVNELIAYYLDVVIHKLESSEDARNILAQSYESYRALHPPKPTYRQFVTDNAIQEEWWHSRLRLLQLLGGSHGSASEYDIKAILERIAPFTNELVPEVIILNGRQSLHREALKLLTHGLGDFDTAINYCLLAGSSIYHPVSGTLARESLPSRDEQSKLFGYLLAEFLQIEDVSDRVEQTGSLLERFGGWFDIGYVLSVIPDAWSVEIVSGFLVSALRRIVRERSETMVARALSGAVNLKISSDLIGKIEQVGPSIEAQN